MSISGIDLFGELEDDEATSTGPTAPPKTIKGAITRQAKITGAIKTTKPTKITGTIK